MPRVSRIKVLVMHGDPLISAGLAATLGAQREFDVSVCEPRVEAQVLENLPQSIDVIVADYDCGVSLITSGHDVRRRVVILTQSQTEAEIRHALEHGARGYLLLGCSLEDLVDGLRSVNRGGTALGPVVASRIADSLTHEALTTRETDVLRLMMLGLSNKVIATKLAVALGTVKSHVKAILAKLNAASRTEAVAIAQQRGILRAMPHPVRRQPKAPRNRVRSNGRHSPVAPMSASA